MKNLFAGLIVLFVAALMLSSCGGMSSEGEITVFAAASLTDVLERIAADYEEQTGTKVRLNLASSGVLARQIISGAPAEIFISANQQWMHEAQDAGSIDPDSVEVFAGNNLVVIAQVDSDLTVNILNDIPETMNIRIAIGDPEHVPAGIYALEALEAAGVWSKLSDSTIRALDVRAVLGYVQRGEVNLGIVYESDIRLIDGIKIVYRIPDKLHSPITYTSGLVSGTNNNAAREFLEYLGTEHAQKILLQYGFLKPE